MITMWQMYWLTRLDSIDLGFILGGVMLIGLGLIGFVALNEGKLSAEDVEAYPLWGVLAGVLLLITSIFIPTTKEMAVILVTPKIVNNEKVQQIPDKLLDLANQKLDEWTKVKEDK